ncbi:phosphonate metabolism protein/1,5-bisphosphokinase PhnN [Brucella abortus bv. 9 str. C68]|nr:phosphonate metabolism protein/1,5-bisphosphokinase PhnN [Brucella abortus bv. 9 str. C68]
MSAPVGLARIRSWMQRVWLFLAICAFILCAASSPAHKCRGRRIMTALMKRILPGRQVRGVLHFTGRRMACVMGLPKTLDDEIAGGAVVIANVSRRVLSDIRRLYTSRSVVVISARTEVLAQRLASRGRESREEIAARLAREVGFDDGSGDVVTIDNSGEVGASTKAFLHHLHEIAVKTIA